MDTKMRDLEYSAAQSHAPPTYSVSYPGSHGPVYNPNNTNVHGTTVITGATVVPTLIVTNNMAAVPMRSVCLSCNKQIVTRVEKVASTRTHLWAGLLCIVGCWLCVCFPYFMDSCKKAQHYCPNCGAYIGAQSL
ncbi:jg17159 [Pararge aegeria aegeria]|uniref:Jg17159 protein n=1 Tax=Pararge aegeria aegeria TaxID=348720 RepID=A0A8S4RP78_9NEOP|nr:jg17159 [Pararge aegeria aegeria]